MNPSSQPENREQTFESKLGDILRTMSIKLITALMMTGKVPDNLYEIEDEAEQAIKTLVLEDVVGEDGYPKEHFPTFLGQATGEIAKRYDKVVTEDRFRAKQRQIINPQKEVSDGIR